MADLLAIISHDPRAPIPAGELGGLAECHESLRGPAAQRHEAGSDRARVCVLGRDGPTIGVETAGAGWTAWAGSRRRQPSAMTAAPAELDGQFSLLRLDEDGETVELATDGLGMKPLFAAVSGERTYVSTSALVLAKHLRAAPSPLGLQAYLRAGLQFGRLTQWEGIERLRPAERRRFAGSGAPTVDTYFAPAPADGGDTSLAAAAELCIERATLALADRYAGERPWIDLTGGFDSRLLALLSRRAGIEFLANTVGDEEDEDVRLARRIAAARGWPWTRLGLPGDWAERLPELLPEAVAWGDGHLDAIGLAAVMDGHREKATVATVLLNGGGGEEFRDHPWGHELWRAGRSNRVDYGRLLAWRILLPIDLSALRADPTAAVTAAFREELEARAEPFAQHPNTFQGDLLYAYKMTGHSGAYQAAAGAAIDLEVPFYLRPILESVMAVAPRQRRFHRLMREMMRQLDPGVAAIPTETGGPAEPPRPGNLHRFAPYAGRRAMRFAVRARGKLPGGNGGAEAAPGPREAAASSLVAALRAQGRLRAATMRSAPLYDQARLEELLERAATRPAAVSWEAVGRIVTVELSLEAAGAALG